MSIVSIRVALETHLNSLTPSIATAWESVPFTPVTGTPYQQVNTAFANPENPTLGDAMYRIKGMMLVQLSYPPNTGTKAASTRADLLVNHFKRATSLTSGGVTVLIDKTPSIAPAIIDGDRYKIPVSIYFTADIYPT
ncbi:MAG: DUF4128 domain-containing protein [Dehalococcoidia bacterium]|jgi:hypothetical protein|nr:DUF4128 domain-containing protein [Dehalococcoidia bacterium]|tara:strand:- start:941 stop:1351 length:411 start_codon:yes stop_codon:yes gene_type:complete